MTKKCITHKKRRVMKRILFTAIAAFMMLTSASAQRLTDITAEAQFITDKMIVEPGLTSNLRNTILQINLDYLNGINSYRDIDSKGWKHRNKRLKRMLSEKQWRAYKKATYFYRPIGWRANAYVHNIYVRYPKRVPMKEFKREAPARRFEGKPDRRRFAEGEMDRRPREPRRFK